MQIWRLGGYEDFVREWEEFVFDAFNYFESTVTGCLRLTDVSVICRAVNSRPTSQKTIWEGFFYVVYRPGEWRWIDSNDKKM